MRLKKHALLYLAIGIPLLMIFVITIGVIFFSVNITPKDNFLYALLDSESNMYTCRDVIKKQFIPDYPYSTKNAKPEDCKWINFYVYDVHKLERSPITKEQALKLAKSKKLTEKSSDNFILANCDYSYPIWGVGPDYYLSNFCFMRKDYRKRINPKTLLTNATNERFVFIGWIPDNTQH